MATQYPAPSRVWLSGGARDEQTHASAASLAGAQPYSTFFAHSDSSNKARNPSQLLQHCVLSSLKDFNDYFGQSKFTNSSYRGPQGSPAKPLHVTGRSYVTPISPMNCDSSLDDNIESFSRLSNPADYTTLNRTSWDNQSRYTGPYATMTGDPIQPPFDSLDCSEFDLITSYDTYPSAERDISCAYSYPILGNAESATHLDQWNQTFNSSATFDQSFPDFSCLENGPIDSPLSIPYSDWLGATPLNTGALREFSSPFTIQEYPSSPQPRFAQTSQLSVTDHFDTSPWGEVGHPIPDFTADFLGPTNLDSDASSNFSQHTHYRNEENSGQLLSDQDFPLFKMPSIWEDLAQAPITVPPSSEVDMLSYELGIGTLQEAEEDNSTKRHEPILHSSHSASTSLAPKLSEPRNVNWGQDKPVNIHSSSANISNRSKIRRKGGSRRGSLTPEIAKKARNIRRVRACLSCWLLKTPCTEGEMCDKCNSLQCFSLIPKLCTRAHLDDYTELFFPRPLTSPLQEKVVEKLTDDLRQSFVDGHMEVGIACGYEYEPMKLRVTEFVPKTEKTWSTPAITTGPSNGDPVFTHRYPAPVALKIIGMDSLVEICRQHVKTMAVKQRQGQTNRQMKIVSKELLRAINNYHVSKSPSLNEALLDKAMMLHAMHYFMGRSLIYTAASADVVLQELRRPTARIWDSNISWLLNRQLKSAMITLLRGVTREILEDLEKELRTRSKAVWATCFCTVCILIFCMEEVQIATDGFVMHKRLYNPDGNNPSPEDAIEICRKLDELPYAYLIELFHGVYKTRKLPMRHRGDHIYNPIRDGAEVDREEGVDQEAVDLANEARLIIKDYGLELKEMAKTPLFGSGHKSLIEHMAFRERNSGRLIANFLLSFQSTGHRI